MSEISRHIQDMTSGDLVLVPNKLDRVDESYNILPSRYVTLLGATGSGKTSFVDDNMILSTFEHIQTNDTDIHWEVIYFSLERKTLFKKMKWISWLMYRNEQVLYPTEFLLGYKKERPDQKISDRIKLYDDTHLAELLEYVTILDGKTKASTILSMVKRKARELGTFYSADSIGITKDNNDSAYIAMFDKSQTRPTKRKGDEMYVELTHNGHTFTMTPNSHKYFPKYKRMLIQIVLDGINLVGDKDDIDEVSEILANSRDLYGFSPIVITQQNRSQSNLDRLKHYGSSMGPQMEDIYKSSQIAFDSDLVLGLFDPYYFKAYDSKGMVGGYQIVKGGTMSPSGFSRFRSLHVLKNSFGYSGKRYGLKFLGEVGHFSTLPLPGAQPLELAQVYEDIAKGH